MFFYLGNSLDGGVYGTDHEWINPSSSSQMALLYLVYASIFSLGCRVEIWTHTPEFDITILSFITSPPDSAVSKFQRDIESVLV